MIAIFKALIPSVTFLLAMLGVCVILELAGALNSKPSAKPPKSELVIIDGCFYTVVAITHAGECSHPSHPR